MILLGMFLLIPKRGLPQEDTGISFGDKSWMIVFFCVTSEELEQLEKQGGDMCDLGFGDIEGWVVVTHNETMLGTQKTLHKMSHVMALHGLFRLHLEVLEPFLSHQTGRLLLATKSDSPLQM